MAVQTVPITYNDVRKALFGLPRAQRLRLLSDAITHIDEPSVVVEAKNGDEEPYSVSFDELREMTEEERLAALDKLVSLAQSSDPELRKGSLERLRASILEYELRYEMTSEQLREGLRTGSIRETAEIAKWLFQLQRLYWHENKT